MKRWQRNILLTVLGIFLFLLLVPLVLYIPPIQNAVCGYARQWVGENTPMQLSIGHFSLRFPLDIRFNDVVVTTATGDTLANVGHVQVSVALMPLLQKRVEVSRVAFHNTALDYMSDDSTMHIVADVGALDLYHGDIALSDNAIKIKDIGLANSQIELLYISTPDTTAQDTSRLQWNVDIAQLAMSDVAYTMYMPSVIDTLAVQLSDARLVNGHISLGQQDVAVGGITIERGDYRYIARGGDEADTVAVEPAVIDTMAIDTVASQPWRVRVDKVKLANNSATYITSDSLPAAGMDFSYIVLDKANIAISDVYNRGSALQLRLDSISMAERSGLSISSGSGSLDMTDKGVMSLKDFVLKTPFSDVTADCKFDMTFFDRNPDAVVELLAKAHLSCRDITYIYPDASRFFVHNTTPGTLVALNDIIVADIAVAGVARDINVERVDFMQYGIFDFRSKARISRPLDKARRHVALSCRLNTTEHLSLANYITDSVMLGHLAMQPIYADANVALESSELTADFYLDCLGGMVDADVTYDMQEERYNATVALGRIPLNLFMPNDTVGHLTARAAIEGCHFAPAEPSTQMAAHLYIDTLGFRNYNYRHIDITAGIEQQQWSMRVNSPAPEIKMELNANGLLQKELLTVNLNARIGMLDLDTLNFVQDPFDVKADINAGIVLSNIDSIVQADCTIDNLVVNKDDHTYSSAPISFIAASDITYSYLDLRTGDLTFNLASDAGLTHLQPSLERLTQLVDTIFETQRLDMKELHQGLPPFVFAAEMGYKNVVQDYLISKGMRVERAQFNASNDSLFNLSALLRRFEVSGITLDTLSLDAYEKSDRLNYRLAVGNRLGNFDELAHAHLEGYLSGNSTRLYCIQNNRKGELGFLFGCKIDFTPEQVQLTFGPKEPIIGYKKWLLNRDNYLSYKYATHSIGANLRLSYDESHLFVTTEDRRRPEIEGIHIDMQNIELSDWFVVSQIVSPMSGNLSADVYVDMPPKGFEASGELSIKEFNYNHSRVGTFHANVDYLLDEAGGNKVKASILHDDSKVVDIAGHLDNSTPKRVKGKLVIDNLPLNVANAFFPHDMGAFTGMLSSELSLTGTLDAPVVNGFARMDNATTTFTKVGASLAFDNSDIKIKNSRVHFDKYAIRGNNNNPLNISGTVDFSRLSNIAINLGLRGDNFQPIHIEENNSGLIYGSVYTDMRMRVRGTLNDLRVLGKISLLSGTNATYIMQSSNSLTSTNYDDMVKFIAFDDTTSAYKPELPEKRRASFSAMLDIELDEGVQLGVNLSTDGKNRIDLIGGGNLLFSASAMGDTRVTGRYNLTGGFVRYTPPFISQKIFNIQDGSYVMWNGELLDPMFNITAIQTQRSTVKSGDDSRLVDFDVSIILKNTLKDLDISFDLSTNDDLAIENELQGLTPEQRESKAMNMFLYNSYTDLATAAQNSQINNPLNTFLAYELNTWAQRTLRGIDLTFGIDDQGLDETGKMRTDYSYKISKSLFDNRLKVVVGGSYASNQDVNTNLSENLIDDVSLEYRITARDNMYLKVFREKNYENIIEGEITETGGGFLYRKQVGSLLDIFRKKRSATTTPSTRPQSRPSTSQAAPQAPDSIVAPVDTIAPLSNDTIAIPLPSIGKEVVRE